MEFDKLTNMIKNWIKAYEVEDLNLLTGVYLSEKNGKRDALVNALEFLETEKASNRQELILYFDSEILKELESTDEAVSENEFKSEQETLDLDCLIAYSEKYVDTLLTIKTTALGILDDTI